MDTTEPLTIPAALTEAESLAVIAATLALPVVDEQLRSIDRRRPTGNANRESIERTRQQLNQEAEPWLARRCQLLDVIRGNA